MVNLDSWDIGFIVGILVYQPVDFCIVYPFCAQKYENKFHIRTPNNMKLNLD